jgi:hypothetical protein
MMKHAELQRSSSGSGPSPAQRSLLPGGGSAGAGGAPSGSAHGAAGGAMPASNANATLDELPPLAGGHGAGGLGGGGMAASAGTQGVISMNQIGSSSSAPAGAAKVEADTGACACAP